MKKLFYICCICFSAVSCKDENKIEDRFQGFLNTLPEINLPFFTNSSEELSTKVETNDSLFKDFYLDSQGILGKIEINDSITGIVYLYAGDIVFPKLVIYNKKGSILSEQILVNLPGGSDGYNSNGSSYMNLSKDFRILITDTIQSFERDSVGIVIDSTWEVNIINYKYEIKPQGKIIEIN